MLHVNSHYKIGITHVNSGKPCQDFALGGLLDNAAAYAIVADGCSSGRHTEMGSMLISFATARAITTQWTISGKATGNRTPEEISFYQQVAIEGVKTTLGLELNDLLTTCVHAFISSDGGYIHIQGDGVFAFKLRTGEILMTRYDWHGNAPCYPAYGANNFSSYIRAQGGDLGAMLLISESWRLNADGTLKELSGTETSLGEGVRGITKPVSQEELAQIEFIAVFTDGVTQIENIPWQQAVVQLLAFKTIAGEFVSRRLIRMVKDAEKIGKGPLDDIACAVIIVPEIETNEPDANKIHKES